MFATVVLSYLHGRNNWPSTHSCYYMMSLTKIKLLYIFAFEPRLEKSKQLSDPQLRPLHYIWERDGQDSMSAMVIGPRGRKSRGSFFITGFKNGCLLGSRMDRQSCKVSATLSFLKIARKYFQTAFFPTRARTSLHRAKAVRLSHKTISQSLAVLKTDWLWTSIQQRQSRVNSASVLHCLYYIATTNRAAEPGWFLHLLKQFKA